MAGPFPLRRPLMSNVHNCTNSRLRSGRCETQFARHDRRAAQNEIGTETAPAAFLDTLEDAMIKSLVPASPALYILPRRSILTLRFWP
jgi:hypothetical protein